MFDHLIFGYLFCYVTFNLIQIYMLSDRQYIYIKYSDEKPTMSIYIFKEPKTQPSLHLISDVAQNG